MIRQERSRHRVGMQKVRIVEHLVHRRAITLCPTDATSHSPKEILPNDWVRAHQKQGCRYQGEPGRGSLIDTFLLGKTTSNTFDPFAFLM